MADLTAQNKWEPLATDNSDREKIWSKSRTFAGDVWFRFRRKPTAIAGFVIIIALMLFALAGPRFTPQHKKRTAKTLENKGFLPFFSCICRLFVA